MAHSESQIEIVITGVGLCSSMGGAVTACAAARAGISRAASLEYLVAADATEAPEPVKGHPASPAKGFVGRARLIALGEQALADLLDTDDKLIESAECGLHLCVTDQDNRRWLPDEPVSEQAVREQERLDARERNAVAEAIVQLAGVDIKPTARQVYVEGAASMAAAVADAATALREGKRDACLVGGVDSLVDSSVVRFLYEAGRLKTPDDPCGLIPGEAAAFLLLEGAEQARKRKHPVLGRIVATAQAEGEDPDEVERPPRGTALAEILARLFEEQGSAEDLFWVLTDQNGESFRAAEWGDFLARASRTLPHAVNAPVWYPAIAFGDTGAASAAVSACIAVRSFARKYAPAPSAVVVSSTHEGGRCGLRIERP